MEPDTIKDQIEAMTTCLNDIQQTMGLNDKGFYILLSYHSGVGIRQCRHLVEKIFELQGEYLDKSKDE